jgi:fatty acid CoA ligase FadD9
MTGDAEQQESTVADSISPARKRVAERVRQLDATDAQFRSTKPKAALQRAAREPGLRLTQILQTFVEGYADRPALGWRAQSLVTDPATDRTTARLLAQFDIISYRDLWANVGAIASAWRHDATDPVTPGDFVAQWVSPAPNT